MAYTINLNNIDNIYVIQYILNNNELFQAIL